MRPAEPRRSVSFMARPTMESAKRMLRHSTDDEPGYSRQKKGRSWAYFDEHGKRITDRDEIDRLNAIALAARLYRRLVLQGSQRPPPGDRPRCPRPQAISLSSRFPRRSATRRNMTAASSSARRCPSSARRVERDLRKRKLDRDTVLAAVVRLLDREHIRVGNEEYAKDNKSFGATTLRSRHVRRKGGKLKMRFTGKHGIVHEADDHRPQPEARRQEVPGTARPDAVPICERRRRAAGDHLSRRQRLYPRRDGRRFHRQAFPHLGRQRHLLRADARQGRGKRASASRRRLSRSPKRSATRPRSAARAMSTRLIDALQDDPRDPLHGMHAAAAAPAAVDAPRPPSSPSSRRSRAAAPEQNGPRLEPCRLRPPQARP